MNRFKKILSMTVAGLFLASSVFGATKLHKDLTGADLHVNKVHASTTHIQGGTDPLTNSTAEGMTGLTTFTQGDLLYYNSGTVLSKLGKDTTATRYLSNTGTNNNPAWAQIALTTGVSGTLPIANGGTNATSFAQSNGLIYWDGTRQVADTAALTSGRVPYVTTNGRLTNSANLNYDGTNFGINTATPSVKLGVVETSAGAITYPVVFGNRGTTNSTEVFFGLQTYDAGSGGITNGISSVTTSNTAGSGSADLKFWTTSGGTRTEKLRIDSAGAVDWTGGNVIYVPLSTGTSMEDALNAAITAATAGDTLVLAAGTWVIDGAVVCGKKVHLKGQGRGITTIYSTSDHSMITNSATAGTLISDMTISHAGAVTGSTRSMVSLSFAANINNVEFLNAATGSNLVSYNCVGDPGVGTAGTSNIENCTFTCTGEVGVHRAVYCGVPGSTINVKNCVGTSNAITSPYVGYGSALIATNIASTINLYNCNFTNPTNTTSGVIHIYGAAASSIKLYNCYVNGSGATGFDVKNESGSATLTLSNCTLANGTSSGTITMAGTVKTANLHVAGSTTTRTLNFAADGEASDDYVITLSPAPTAYTTGMPIYFTANTANTGACTVNVNGLGAKSLKSLHDQDPADSYIEAGSVVHAVYDGTNFQIMNPDANP